MQVGAKIKMKEAGHAGADVKVGEVLTITKMTNTDIFAKREAKDKDSHPETFRFKKARVGAAYEVLAAAPAKNAKPEAPAEKVDAKEEKPAAADKK